jgi:iron complex outermembrane recepter protein
MRTISIGRTATARAVLLASAAVACIAAPQAALAQDEADDAIVESAAPAVIGNDIIVSATKRDETLQDVPVAVSVTTAETLERAEIRDIKDLQTEVPSLRVNQNQSSAQTTFTIRGFGNGANNAGIEPSVGVFVDGVYRSRITSRISDFPDIQRVEVLRGPQSTLFGKNASVGVISIVTQEPQFDFGGMVEASYGNYDQMIGKAVITGPLADTVAASIAGGFNFRDGYIEDLGSGNDLNDRNRWFVRGQLLFEPSADLKIRLIGDYDELDESCCGVILLQPSLATGAIQLLGGQQSDPSDPYADVTYNNFDAENKLKNYGVSGQVDWSFGDATLTSITSWRKSDALTRQDVDFSSADLIYPFLTDIRAETFTQELRLAAEFGDRVDVLVGAFYLNDKIDQTGELRYGEDARGYVNLLIQSLTGGAQTLGSIEQTIGALYGNPAQYVGDFYSFQSGLAEVYSLDNESISIFGQVDFEVVDGLTVTLGGNYTKDSKDFTLDANSSDVFAGIDLIDAGNRAIYAQGLAQQIGGIIGHAPSQAEIQQFAIDNPGTFAAISAGVQAQADVLDTNPAFNPFLALQPYQFMPPFLDVPNSVEPGETDDDKFTYTVRVAYDVNDNLNIYATYATGFKASSINLSRDSRPALSDQGAIEGAGLDLINQGYGSRFAGPEESTVYEAGLKGNWPGISANLAVFQQEIKGFQSNIFTGSGFFLSNAGKQSTFGIEFEGMAELFDDFTVNFGITYLDPTYDDFEFSSVGDLTGTTPSGIPEISMTVGAQYEYDLSNGDDIIARVSYHYESDVKVIEGLAAFRDPNDPDAAIEAADPFHRQVDELSASLAYQFDMGLELSVWGRNLLNDRYLQLVFDTPAQPRSISGYPNQPRTYGITGRFRF